MSQRQLGGPFFSVVIPALNEEKALPHLLSDLLNQSWTDFDVSVVDGGSKDKSVEVVKHFAKKDPRFHLIESAKRGVSVQRNLGARSSSGANLLFLDADSRIPSYFLEEEHVQMLKNPADGWTNYAASGSRQNQDNLYFLVQNAAFEGAARLGKPAAVGACIGCTRLAFETIGGFEESMQFMEDTAFVQEFPSKNLSFAVYREPKYVFSLRRFRKEGTLKIMRVTLRALRAYMMNEKNGGPMKDYPMLGGEYFHTKKTKRKAEPKTILQLRRMGKDLQRAVRSRNRTIRRLIHDLRQDLEL